LLHLGDFAADCSVEEPVLLDRFDAWLAGQPHRTKIVLRGNHDPRFYDFPRSGASYLAQAAVRELGGYRFAFVPFLSGGLRRKKCLPKRCDVLVSHVPPRRMLDRCATGKCAGSDSLLKGARKMTAGPPALWLCGHIHESRGVLRGIELCGANKETTLVNAANANSGIASHIEYGPTVIQLGVGGMLTKGNTKLRNNVQIVNMDGQYVFMNQRLPAFFRSTSKSDGVTRMLLAIDLGLRTGVSLFDESGVLLRFEGLHFDSTEVLEDAARDLLTRWELDANEHLVNVVEEVGSRESGCQHKITHVAIEGEDPPLLQAWRNALADKYRLLCVKPEAWRADLLTAVERQSGESSKAASRVLAGHVIASNNSPVLHQKFDREEFQTDVAESILLGVHVLRRLGWGTLQDPAIARSNGQLLRTTTLT
jgi:hypothetical protein